MQEYTLQSVKISSLNMPFILKNKIAHKTTHVKT